MHNGRHRSSNIEHDDCVAKNYSEELPLSLSCICFGPSRLIVSHAVLAVDGISYNLIDAWHFIYRSTNPAME
jgi:hypothetical protein